jgi:peptidoglycan-associated lipoprotein
MKTTRVIELAVSAVALAVLSACASEVTKPESSSPASTASSAPVAPPAQAAATSHQGVSGSALGAEQRSTIDKRSVYYDFDAFALKAEYTPVVDAQASYLKQHPGASVRVEGNCDERGSREYNLALGQRRADSVAKMLELAGVSTSQIEAVSYGKEKPRASGHDEQAWSQNRRSDFDYLRQ